MNVDTIAGGRIASRIHTRKTIIGLREKFEVIKTCQALGRDRAPVAICRGASSRAIRSNTSVVRSPWAAFDRSASRSFKP